MGRVVKGFFPIYPPSTVAVWRRNIFPVVCTPLLLLRCSATATALSGLARFPCTPISRRLTRSAVARTSFPRRAGRVRLLAPKCRTLLRTAVWPFYLDRLRLTLRLAFARLLLNAYFVIVFDSVNFRFSVVRLWWGPSDL